MNTRTTDGSYASPYSAATSVLNSDATPWGFNFIPSYMLNVTQPVSNVLLRNGETVPIAVMGKTMMNMQIMLTKDPDLFWTRLVEKAKNPNYELSSLDETTLIKYLMLHNGKIHQHVRAIILSSVEGESSEKKWVHPAQPI